MTVIYGLIIAIPLVVLALWGFRKIRDGNDDAHVRQLCMIWEKDFLSYADRNDLSMEEIIFAINVSRVEINKEIKKKKWQIPLLDSKSLTTDKTDS